MFFDKNTVISSVDDLVEYYRQANKKNELLIGIEWERSGVHRDTIEPVQYEGDQGYLAVLKKLSSEAGWEIVKGHRNYIYELKRGNALVTIETDGRLELSGSAKDNLHDLAREYRIHANEVKEVSDFLNIGWLPLGWQPFNSDKELSVIKDKRYKIILKLIRSKLTGGYFKCNNGLTVNFSYSDEVNAIRKVQTAFRIIPIIGAIFASSPLRVGKISRFLDFRRYCTSQFFPGRNTLPKNILNPDFTFRDWLEHYLKLKVLLITRKNKNYFCEKDNLSFFDWIKNGYKGMRPTLEDFHKHLKNNWSDIKLRPGYLEYRVADSVPFKIAMSVPALIKGLVFDSNSWEAVEKLTKGWTYEDVIEIDKKAWKEGLKTKAKGKTLLWYAKQLIEISNEALHRFNKTKAVNNEEDESIYLAPLKEQIFIKEKSVAKELAELWQKDWGQDPRRLLEWCEEDM